MTIIIGILAALAFVAIIATVRSVGHDGYAQQPTRRIL
jgi:hypothetical protein